MVYGLGICYRQIVWLVCNSRCHICLYVDLEYNSIWLHWCRWHFVAFAPLDKSSSHMPKCMPSSCSTWSALKKCVDNTYTNECDMFPAFQITRCFSFSRFLILKCIVKTRYLQNSICLHQNRGTAKLGPITWINQLIFSRLNLFVVDPNNPSHLSLRGLQTNYENQL